MEESAYHFQASNGAKVFNAIGEANLSRRELKGVDSDAVAGVEIAVNVVLEKGSIGFGDDDSDVDAMFGKYSGLVHHGDHVAWCNERKEKHS